jgi:hypothetical protein
METTVIMKNSLITCTLLILLLTAGLAAAQEPRETIPRIPCPYPFAVHLTGGPGAPSPAPVLQEFPANLQQLIAGSLWTQKAINKQFGHTFHFPSSKECCLMTKATLTLHLIALQGGAGATSANDGVSVYANHQLAGQSTPWSQTVTTGDTTTITFSIPANLLTGGMVSFYVQDDTAVESANLDVEGCCLKRP